MRDTLAKAIIDPSHEKECQAQLVGLAQRRERIQHWDCAFALIDAPEEEEATTARLDGILGRRSGASCVLSSSGSGSHTA